MLRRIVLSILILAAVVILIRALPVREWIMQSDVYVRTLGPMGPVLWTVLYVACTVLFIPGSALSLAAAGLFGFKTAFLVVLVGANIGALCAFLLARSFLRAKVVRWAEGNPKFKSLDRAIGRQGFRMVLLSRLSPAFPFTLLNYLLGLTAVRTGSYVLANLLGMLPGTFLYIYIGVAAQDVISGQADVSTGFYQEILKYGGLLATIAVVVFIARLARRALREAEQRQGGSL